MAEGALITQQATETAGPRGHASSRGADGILTPDWIAAAGDAALTAHTCRARTWPSRATSTPTSSSPPTPRFSGEDAPISVFHAHAYDAYNMIVDAIEEVAFTEDGTTFIPRTALRDAFFGISGYEGITGS